MPDPAPEERPTLEELRERQSRRERQDVEVRMAMRWAKDWLLYHAGAKLAEFEATLPEDADESVRGFLTLKKIALREFWDSYEFPPDYSYPRPYADYEPPEDFDFGAIMERFHARMDEKFGDLRAPEGWDDEPPEDL